MIAKNLVTILHPKIENPRLIGLIDLDFGLYFGLIGVIDSTGSTGLYFGLIDLNYMNSYIIYLFIYFLLFYYYYFIVIFYLFSFILLYIFILWSSI